MVDARRRERRAVRRRRRRREVRGEPGAAAGHRKSPAAGEHGIGL
ncbi:hypothetical protein [Actinomadura sediminis]|uniref:Uncharacterized protein n=1 Tax=Actinomadura sediminis TaxID=1038904 RepID=A0ABW3EJD2_9ACTN